MPARWLPPDATIGAARGDVVVCIPLYGAHEHFIACLRSVLAHTAKDVAILVCDDASPDRRSEELVRALDAAGELDHELCYVTRAANVGFPANVNGGFAAAAPADVVILNSDCVVAAGWLEGLREAAYVDSTVATASALSNHGSILSVPDRGIPLSMLPQDWSLEDAAAAVRSRSPRLRPRLPTAVGHCVYVRRSALELVGDFDLAFSPGYGEEVDFSQRCLRAGLCHVAADEVLVFHRGGASLANHGHPNPVQAEHEEMLAARYPYYHEAVGELERDVAGPLARSLGAARRALKGLSIVFDARILAGAMTGTQLHVLELIAAVARTGEARITAIVPGTLSAPSRALLETLPDVQLTSHERGKLRRHVAKGDVVHRPFQLSRPDDLTLLAALGERIVITHQDLIGYRNPSYFRTFGLWHEYRFLTRRGLAIADRVLFFSAHARDDAIAEDLIEPHRASVVRIGVDHSLAHLGHAVVKPRAAARVPEDVELIVCLGTDFRHKNRVFALRVLDELQRRHGFTGWLAFVGPHVSFGSSGPEEEELLALNPRLAQATVDMAAVSEGEKQWLLQRARLVLYPTVYEGFGLVPFEAADHGVPCAWARGTSLSEILPDDAAELEPWDAAASADRVLALLNDTDARERNVAAVRAAATQRTWNATAAELIGVYHATCDASISPAGALERTAGLMNGGVSEDALRLIGPGGALPRDLERPLLALATHPQVGTPVFNAIKAGYRASHRLRRRREGNGSSGDERNDGEP